MNRVLVALVSSVALFAASASQTFAAGNLELNKTVKLLSLKEGGAAVSVNDASSSAGCDSSSMVFDATTPVGRIWYATLLEALSTGASLNLVFERNANLCQLVKLEIY